MQRINADVSERTLKPIDAPGDNTLNVQLTTRQNRLPNPLGLPQHPFAALAQKERALISQRAKEGFKAAKARGQKLGNP